jgi:uroporphyrinogen decarboxylase
MTPKERAYAALERKEPDRVPLFEAWMDTIVVEKIINRPVKVVHDLIDFYKKLELDFVAIPPGGWHFKRVGDTLLDEWGIKWQVREGGIVGQFVGFGFYIEGMLKTPEKFHEFEFPDPVAPGRLDDFETASKAVGSHYAVTGVLELAIFERAALQVGLRDFLRFMYTDPSFAHEVLRKNYEYSLELGKALLDTGAEFILIGDDLADNHGPFMSPKLYRDFIHPYYKDLVRSLKRRGAKVIFHSDGNLIPIIDDILDWGIDGLHPIQPGAMDIIQFKRDYGSRIAVVGGVDMAKLLPFGSEEDVERAVMDVIRQVSPGGGHILGSSNSLHSFVPDMGKYVKNILRYVNTAHKFGTYPIRNG